MSTSKKAETMDEVMLAMDVVDTLRRNKRLAEHELQSDTKEQELLDRLKEIYGAQGIDVSDEILRKGVKALREDRFVYKKPAPSFSLILAKIYINRMKWGKPALALFLLVFLFCIYALIQSGSEQDRPEPSSQIIQQKEK